MVSMFCDFMRTYNKSYKDQEEEAQRFKIFVENLERARQQQETEIGSARYGVTKFSDLSAEEFQQGSRALSVPLTCKQFSDKLPNDILQFVDWRKKKRVTRVKNQQVSGRSNCSSCWAFAVVGNVESHVSIREKELITLSEQELLDCGNEKNNCNIGYINLAFQDVLHRGLHREDAYPPYTAERLNCRENVSQPEYKIKKCVSLQNETEMQQFVAKKGPVAIMVNIFNSLQQYIGGIIRTDNQTNKNVHYHAMLIVGYGTDADVPYWIVKNSWGEKWGENGYVRIYRGANVGKIGDYALSSVV